MLTELYIEALLVDAKGADAVWDAWDQGKLSDFVAAWAWWSVRFTPGSGHWPDRIVKGR